MALPVLTRHLAHRKLTAYCAQKLPAEMHDKVRFELEDDGDAITLLESRPHFRHKETWTRLPVARFLYNQGSGTWSLFRLLPGNPGTWQAYPSKPQRDMDQLIKLLDTDTTGAFWG